MKRFAPLAMLLFAAMLALMPAALVLAQEGEVVLVPFSDDHMGYSGVYPEGWQQTERGVFQRISSTTDLAAIVQQAALTYTADQIATSILNGLGQPALPEDVTVVETESLTWNIYEIIVEAPQLGTVIVNFGLAETPFGTYFMLLQSLAEDNPALYDSVYLPAIDAFTPYSLNWAQDETIAFEPEMAPQLLVPNVIEERVHDPACYTQGLLLFEGSLYESCGLYGESTLREVDPETGEALREVDVPEQYFAEGLERVDDRLIQITWQEQDALVYDLETFEVVDTFNYEGEGWGLCYDGEYLYMSDGSSFITIRDAETFDVVDRGLVTFMGQMVDELNELECAGDYIYSNVWRSDMIFQIDKHNGNIVGIINAEALLDPEVKAGLGNQQVLNGIVWQPESETFLITGKQWPALFEVTFEPEAAPSE